MFVFDPRTVIARLDENYPLSSWPTKCVARFLKDMCLIYRLDYNEVKKIAQNEFCIFTE